jgi:hypothetical protein
MSAAAEESASATGGAIVPVKAELQYNAHLEDIIASEAEKALVLRWLHNAAEHRYSKFNTWITLPVITISTLAGTASIGSQTLFGPDAPAAPVLIGLMSLLVSILNVIASFFGWAKRAEGHRISSINYGKMHRWISIELALPREQRVPAKHFLKEIRQQIDRMNETSPQVPVEVIAQFRLRVKDLKSNVSLPEICDEIHCVEVYSGDVLPPSKLAGSAMPVAESEIFVEPAAAPTLDAPPKVRPSSIVAALNVVKAVGAFKGSNAIQGMAGLKLPVPRLTNDMVDSVVPETNTGARMDSD